MCGYVACGPEYRGSVCCASQLRASTQNKQVVQISE
jgi:hypothetical protein